MTTAAYSRAYRLANPERVRLYEQRRYQKDRDSRNAQGRARYHAKPEVYAARARRTRLSRYGLADADYERLFTAQGGACAVCGQPETAINPRTGQVKRLHVDHDHSCCPAKASCGACIRGLLCGRCNTALGLFDDDPDRLAAASAYLKPA